MPQAKARSREPRGRPAPVEADPHFALAGLIIVAGAVLGGASRENPLRLAAVELCAIPLLALEVRRLGLSLARPRPDLAPLAILAAIIAVPLAQLIPLPPALWSNLPGQAPRMEALTLAGLKPGWLPMTLTPAATWGMLLALAPPSALFLATLHFTRSQVRRAIAVWVILAGLGLLLGVAQMAMPAGGPAYPYRTTNLGSLVGLFANRNHEAGFLLALLPLAATLMLPVSRQRGRASAGGLGDGGPAVWLAGVFLVVSVVALGVIRSRAGVILAAPSIAAVFAVVWRGGRDGPARRRIAGLGGALAFAALAVATFGLTPILDRFAPQATNEIRAEAWPYVARAAKDFLPLGAGLGAFVPVYQAVEPLDLVTTTYLNHAHNDYLELWLETGVSGAGILLAFIGWLGWASWRAWRGTDTSAKAASAAVLLLMAESAVDYPLRTETLLLLLAFCCGLLARPATDPGAWARP